MIKHLLTLPEGADQFDAAVPSRGWPVTAGTAKGTAR